MSARIRLREINADRPRDAAVANSRIASALPIGIDRQHIGGLEENVAAIFIVVSNDFAFWVFSKLTKGLYGFLDDTLSGLTSI